MKQLIPENLKGKELFKFLAANKGRLIASKKAAMKTTDSLMHVPTILTPVKATATTKAAGAGDGDTDTDEETGRVDVKVVANSAWFCDSSMDVLTDKCYDKSISEKGNLIPHIFDHVQKSTSHVGDVKNVYTQKMPLKDMGFDGDGNTTVLIFETTIREDYNEDVFKFYKNRKINQHSIGLIYVTIGLCINDKEFLPEFELWNKYYDKVINKDVIDQKGYFWIVPEIKVMENSCVLFACNELTPTLEVVDTDSEPSGNDTQDQPSNKSLDSVDWDKIASFLAS